MFVQDLEGIESVVGSGVVDRLLSKIIFLLYGFRLHVEDLGKPVGIPFRGDVVDAWRARSYGEACEDDERCSGIRVCHGLMSHTCDCICVECMLASRPSI